CATTHSGNMLLSGRPEHQTRITAYIRWRPAVSLSTPAILISLLGFVLTSAAAHARPEREPAAARQPASSPSRSLDCAISTEQCADALVPAAAARRPAVASELASASDQTDDRWGVDQPAITRKAPPSEEHPWLVHADIGREQDLSVVPGESTGA